jgi:hypothetical protein
MTEKEEDELASVAAQPKIRSAVPMDTMGALLKLFERIVAQYRRGRNIYVIADEISQEWERQNLPCAVPSHAKMHDLD